MDFLIFWLTLSILGCVVCLVVAGGCYEYRDRNGVRQYLKAAVFCLVWPIALPVAIFFGIRGLYRYGFKDA
jgi:hypothetical protein